MGTFANLITLTIANTFYTTIIKAILMEHDFMQALAQSNPSLPYHHCLQNIQVHLYGPWENLQSSSILYTARIIKNKILTCE